MKKEFMFMLCAIVAATTLCTAQVKRQEKAFCKEKCAEMTKKATERMKTDLSLTDEQAAKVEALNNEYLPQMRNCRKPMHHGKKGDYPKGKECEKRKDCPNAKKCDKANECPKNKECKKNECPKVKDCPNVKECREACRNSGDQPLGKSKEEVQKKRKEYKEKLNAILTPEQQEKYQALHKERREQGKHRRPKK